MIRFQNMIPEGVFIADDRDKVLSQKPFTAWMPARALVPLCPGTSGSILVVPGQTLIEGTLLTGPGKGGLATHAPIPGKVMSFQTVTLADGKFCQAVEIGLEGGFSYFDKVDAAVRKSPVQTQSLIDDIRNAGLPYGKDNADFADIIDTALATKVQCIVVDGLETTPFNMVDHALIKYHAAGVHRGTQWLRQILDADRLVVVLPKDFQRESREFVRLLQKAKTGLEIVYLEARYPRSNPSVLLHHALGKPLVPNADPLQDGVLVVRPEELFLVHEALDYHKPYIETFVSVCGSAVKQPQVVRARIGTPLWQIIEDAGGVLAVPTEILIDNPMTGYRTQNIDLPVSKTTHSLILNKPGSLSKPVSEACIHCGQCVMNCPSLLEPELLYKQIVHGKNTGIELQRALADCIECGLCSYVCPANLPLSKTFRELRNAFRAGGGNDAKA